MHVRRRSVGLSFGILAVALALDGCGGSTATTPAAPVVAPQQQSQFAVPNAIAAAIPPAPPSVIPASPSAAQRAAVQHRGTTVAARFAHTRAISTAADGPNQTVRFSTTLGDIDVLLRADAAPKNVANFLSYVDSGAYAGSFIHRSIPGFIIQGGGYTVGSNGAYNAIAAQPSVVDEFDLSNVRGTLAMATVSGNPNSATSQWFFNEANNTSLDTQNGGSTVVGQVEDSQGLAVMDAIGAVNVPSPSPLQPPLSQTPLQNYTTGTAAQASNLIYVESITRQAGPAFFDGEVDLGNGVFSLTFPNGTPFGSYSYLSDPRYIYHFDLGYEYTFDANDGQSGIYLYDFASNSFLYTSPSFQFPYLYDFSLKSVVYYYPNTASSGQYTTGPRYFYDFATHAIITM